MFSFGNINEKIRVSKLNCSDETVVDLFCGIGYFTLQFLVNGKAKYVHACDWNPNAIEALQVNLKLNNVQERCQVHFGDNRLTCPQNVADRVYLGLIPTSRGSWSVACRALKQDTGGILHIHDNVSTFGGKDKRAKQQLVDCWKANAVKELELIFSQLYSNCSKWSVTALNVTKVKSYAPHIDHLVLDVACYPVQSNNGSS